ncbi:MAG: hypothetical protein IKB42_00570 [Clostridia bacterium]|nr:hypothetical protein [Clostridia bacterium]
MKNNSIFRVISLVLLIVDLVLLLTILGCTMLAIFDMIVFNIFHLILVCVFVGINVLYMIYVIVDLILNKKRENNLLEK